MRIRGAAVFSGYFNDTARTSAAFDEDGYYRTGDLFEVAADGGGPRFYRFVGRAGDVINRGGMKIVPEELEALLAGHPAIAEAAVVGYPDDVMNEKTCVVLVPREGAVVGLDDVRAYLEDRGLGPYKLPEKLLVLERMPRNPVGKLLKHELRERAAGTL
jgi:non-ribosomal peptide synthetase component E (peptide arylation enzyme)